MELKELGVRKGDNAFKVYKFLDSPEPTMKEKMEIKRKYSLMAGIKLDGTVYFLKVIYISHIY